MNIYFSNNDIFQYITLLVFGILYNNLECVLESIRKNNNVCNHCFDRKGIYMYKTL